MLRVLLILGTALQTLSWPLSTSHCSIPDTVSQRNTVPYPDAQPQGQGRPPMTPAGLLPLNLGSQPPFDPLHGASPGGLSRDCCPHFGDEETSHLPQDMDAIGALGHLFTH